MYNVPYSQFLELSAELKTLWFYRLMWPGAQFFQGALGTFRFAGHTGGSPKKDKLQAEVVPGSFRDNAHQIVFDFYRIIVDG